MLRNLLLRLLVSVCCSSGIVFISFAARADTAKDRIKVFLPSLETASDSLPVTYVIVTALFVVDKKGKLGEIEFLSNECTTCNDKEKQAMETIVVKIINDMPNWTPGKQNGRLVKVRYNVPVKFELLSDKLCLPEEYKHLLEE